MPVEGVSTEQRRGSKPLVEKKRRARINRSLAELQALVVDTKKKQGHSRVEKADILESTVRYLQSLKKQQKEDYYQTRYANFRAGYMECMEEVCRFLILYKHKDTSTLEEKIRAHLTVRLPPRVQLKSDPCPEDEENKEPQKKKVKKEVVIFKSDADSSKVSTTTPSCSPPPQLKMAQSPQPQTQPSSSTSPSTGLPADGYPQALPVIPSCLPTGQLAFVVPTREYLQYVSTFKHSLMVTQDVVMAATTTTATSQIRNPGIHHHPSSSSSPPPPSPGTSQISHGSHQKQICDETALNLCMTPQSPPGATLTIGEHTPPPPPPPKSVFPELCSSSSIQPGQMWRPW